MFKCTKCAHKLTDTKGCVFCLDFKQNYLTIVEDDLDIKAVKVGNRGLRAASNDLAKLEVALNDKKEYDPLLSRELQVVIKNITMLMEVIRKLEKTDTSEEKETTFTEQKAIFIEWLDNLPIMLRADVLRVVQAEFKDTGMQIAGN